MRVSELSETTLLNPLTHGNHMFNQINHQTENKNVGNHCIKEVEDNEMGHAVICSDFS